jgi:hypothetical protein
MFKFLFRKHFNYLDEDQEMKGPKKMSREELEKVMLDTTKAIQEARLLAISYIHKGTNDRIDDRIDELAKQFKEERLDNTGTGAQNEKEID